jgi:hypothetical protein
MAKNFSVKKTLATVLISLGIIGYVIAAFLICVSLYFYIVAELHPNASIDSSAGFAPIGSIFAGIDGVVVAGVASLLFWPGKSLKAKLKINSRNKISPKSQLLKLSS